MKTTIFYIYGASCAGKSTLVDKILQKYPMFHIKRDTIKWFFSDYDRYNESQQRQINQILVQLLESRLEFTDLPVLVEGFDFDVMQNFASKYKENINFKAIKVTADESDLINRFKKRLNSVKNADDFSRISNKSEEVFKKIIEVYELLPVIGLEINTSKLSEPESWKKLDKYLDFLSLDSS